MCSELAAAKEMLTGDFLQATLGQDGFESLWLIGDLVSPDV